MNLLDISIQQIIVSHEINSGVSSLSDTITSGVLDGLNKFEDKIIFFTYNQIVEKRNQFIQLKFKMEKLIKEDPNQLQYLSRKLERITKKLEDRILDFDNNQKTLSEKAIRVSNLKKSLKENGMGISIISIN